MKANDPHSIMPTSPPAPQWASHYPGQGLSAIGANPPPQVWPVAQTPPGVLTPPAFHPMPAVIALQPQFLWVCTPAGPASPPGSLAWVQAWYPVSVWSLASPAPLLPPPPAAPATSHFKPPAAPVGSFNGEGDDEDRPLQEDPAEVVGGSGCPTLDHWLANVERWHQNDPSISLIFGPADYRMIDFLLSTYLRPHCFGSELVQAYVRQLFPRFSPDEADEFDWIGPTKLVQPYQAVFCQIMLDCSVVDPALDRSLPIAAGLEMARKLGCLRHFEAVLVRQLGMKTRDVRAIKARAADILAEARR
jgi:hypothetical protein